MKAISNVFVLVLLAFASTDAQDIFMDKSGLSSPLSPNPVLPPPLAPAATSYWAGATLAYNLEKEGSDNLIGAGHVKIGTVKGVSENKFFDLLVVGNIAKVTSSISEDSSDDITEIIQSNQGFSIGLSPVWILNKGSIRAIRERIDNGEELEIPYVRMYGNIGYKLNGFQDVGEEEATINISQFRSSVGLEYEGLHLDIANAPMHFSSELIYTIFGKDNYKLVFGEALSQIIALENTAIIPLSAGLGIMFKYTVSKQNVLQAGLVIRSFNND